MTDQQHPELVLGQRYYIAYAGRVESAVCVQTEWRVFRMDNGSLKVAEPHEFFGAAMNTPRRTWWQWLKGEQPQ